MADYHPLTVHFPIALLISGCIAELIGFLLNRDDLRHFAFWALILGLASTGVAYISGTIAEAHVEHLPGIHHNLEAHEEMATIALCTWVGLVGFRILLTLRNWLDNSIFLIYLLLLLSGTILMGITGHGGGQLVYQQGAGIHLSKTQPKAPHHHHNED